MRKLIFLFLFINVVAKAQIFVDVGVNGQYLTMTPKQSPAINAISLIIQKSRGNPDLIFPRRLYFNSISPKLNIGYRLPFNDLNILFSIGISQDLDNSKKFGRVIAIRGKNYLIPEAFSLKGQVYYNFNGFCLGGEYVFDNQKSEFLLNGSNLDIEVIGLLNQISSDLNLLGINNRFTQINGLLGYQRNRGHLQFESFILAGKLGNAWGLQCNIKLRIFLNKIK